MDAFKAGTSKTKHIGVGGAKCPCCANRISRKLARRQARRTLRAQDKAMLKTHGWED